MPRSVAMTSHFSNMCYRFISWISGNILVARKMQEKDETCIIWSHQRESRVRVNRKFCSKTWGFGSVCRLPDSPGLFAWKSTAEIGWNRSFKLHPMKFLNSPSVWTSHYSFSQCSASWLLVSPISKENRHSRMILPSYWGWKTKTVFFSPTSALLCRKNCTSPNYIHGQPQLLNMKKKQQPCTAIMFSKKHNHQGLILIPSLKLEPEPPGSLGHPSHRRIPGRDHTCRGSNGKFPGYQANRVFFHGREKQRNSLSLSLSLIFCMYITLLIIERMSIGIATKIMIICMQICVCACLYTHTNMYTYIYIYIYACVNIWICIYVYMYVYVCVYVYCMYMYTCMYEYVCIYRHVYTYTYT